MTTDWKALCVELTEYLALLDEPPSELVVRAQAALSEPEPPSLAEQALAALNEIEDRYAGPSTQEILVRRALERLQELESNG